MNAVAPAVTSTVAEAQPAKFAAMEMAALLTSGLTGRPLLAELWRSFGAVTRGDAFLAIAVASAVWEADLTIAEAELTVLKVRANG